MPLHSDLETLLTGLLILLLPCRPLGREPWRCRIVLPLARQRQGLSADAAQALMLNANTEALNMLLIVLFILCMSLYAAPLCRVVLLPLAVQA